jgi:GTPase SAR1 family protein
VTNFNGIPLEFVIPTLSFDKSSTDDVPNSDKFVGLILVYSVTDAYSFTKVLQWWETSGKRSLPTIIVGNKSDEPENLHAAPAFKANVIADRLNLKLFQVSAKTEFNIRVSVQSLIETIMLRKLVLRQPNFKPLNSATIASEGEANSFVVLVVGIPSVGRTSVVHRIVDRSFGPTSTSTSIEVCPPINVNGMSLQFVVPITDTVENYDSLPYVSKAAGILLVYDITNDSSFAKPMAWWETTQRKLPTVAIGNRIDDASRRKVSLERAVQWGERNRVKVFEVSAKLGLYVQLAVEYLAELIKNAPH